MAQLLWRDSKKCFEKYLDLSWLPPEARFVYRNGNSMYSPEASSCLFTAAAFISNNQSQDVIVVGCEETRQFLLVGALTAFRSLTYFTLQKENRMIGLRMVQPYVKPDEKGEEVVTLQGSDWRDLLKQYAEMVAAAMHIPPVKAGKNLTGYCTWYYYYADVTEKDFLENVAALKAKVGSDYSPAVIQIDDGYQTFQGDWLDQDPSWPTPLAKIAAEITGGGMTAGIWLMPFLASTASRIFRLHPEWFVKNTAGDPLVFAGWSPAPDNLWACLDATQEAVRNHITKVMQTFWQMGFRYFKMDGLAFGFPDGCYSDPDATPVSAFRIMMKTIREAVPNATLLGCGTPFMAALGYIDLSRVSGDTSRFWCGDASFRDNPPNCDNLSSGIATAWHGTVANYWKIDVWFRADPDVIMARADNAFYTIGEARISAAAGILTGIALTSDHLGRITAERLAILERAARYRLRNPRPEKWTPNRWPYAFSGTVDGKKALLLVNDSNVEMTHTFADYGLPQECEELLIGLGPVKNTLTLPSHDACLLVTR